MAIRGTITFKKRWFDPSKEVFGTYITEHPDKAEVLNFETIEQDRLSRLWLISESFLFSRVKHSHCVLVRFVPPYGNHVSTMKAQWSKDFLVLTNVVNNNSILNKKVPINSRFTTFEASGLDVAEVPLKPDFTRREVDDICQKISQHVEKLTEGVIKINHFEIYLRRDDKCRLWLLFCTEIKLINLGDKGSILPSNVKGSSKSINRIIKPKTMTTKKIKKLLPTEFCLINRERYIEPENFLKLMQLQSEENGQLIENLGKLHCSFCIQIKSLDFCISMKQLTIHLAFNKDNHKVYFNEGDGHVKKFIKNLLINEGMRARGHDDLKLYSNAQSADPEEELLYAGQTPQALEWAIGMMQGKSLIKKLNEKTFQSVTLKCCCECYLKYTQHLSLQYKIAQSKKPVEDDYLRKRYLKEYRHMKELREKQREIKRKQLSGEPGTTFINKNNSFALRMIEPNVISKTSFTNIEGMTTNLHLRRPSTETTQLLPEDKRTKSRPNLTPVKLKDDDHQENLPGQSYINTALNTSTHNRSILPESSLAPQYLLHKAFITSKGTSKIDKFEQYSQAKQNKTSQCSFQENASKSKFVPMRKRLEDIITSKFVDKSIKLNTLETSVSAKPRHAKYPSKSFSRDHSLEHGSFSGSQLIGTVKDLKLMAKRYSLSTLNPPK